VARSLGDRCQHESNNLGGNEVSISRRCCVGADAGPNEIADKSSGASNNALISLRLSAVETRANAMPA
jgi:hypothetical protein